MRSKLNVIDQLNFIVNIDQLTSKVKLAMLDTHTHTPRFFGHNAACWCIPRREHVTFYCQQVGGRSTSCQVYIVRSPRRRTLK